MIMTDRVSKAFVLQSVSWFGIASAIQTVMKFAIGILVARLLNPEAFGLFAIGLLAIGAPTELLRLPIGDAIVNRQEDKRLYYDMAWSLKMRRLPIAMLVYLLAPSLAGFFHQPEAVGVIRWLSIGYAIAAFESPAALIWRIRLQFNKLALFPHIIFWIELVTNLVVALVVRNVYALVAGYLVKSVATVVLSYMMFPYRPRLALDLRELRALLSFGGWIWLERLMISLSDQSVTALTGKLLDSTSLGLYSKARSLVLAPLQFFQTSLQPVLFPTYSVMQYDLERVRRYNHLLIAAYLILSTFVGGVMYCLAEDLVRILLGEAWLGMVALLRAFVPVFLLHGPILVLGPSVFKGIGRPDINTKMQLIHTVCLPLFTLGGIHWFGAVGIVYALGLTFLIDSIVWSKNIIQLGLLDLRTLLGLFGPVGLVLVLGVAFLPSLASHVVAEVGAGFAFSTVLRGLVVALYFSVACVLVMAIKSFSDLRRQVLQLAEVSVLASLRSRCRRTGWLDSQQ